MFTQSDGFSGHHVNNHISGTMKTVFVTVGTTCFDDLIFSLTSEEVVQVVNGECI